MFQEPEVGKIFFFKEPGHDFQLGNFPSKERALDNLLIFFYKIGETVFTNFNKTSHPGMRKAD
jgi:hypothetical protein